ncbi:MAG TPA: iron chelate uptake ABC transporter family permease subunit [Solirubrobacteraceae bacterium]|nr:iron chelate uptake ABC transporter family permease subunit [Solirubrobacteraceae bacterium]
MAASIGIDERAGAPRAPRPAPAAVARRRRLGLIAVIVVLVAVALLSVAIGARGIAPGRVWELLWHPDGSDESIIVHDLRIPRTILGLLVGSALGVAGALMQGLTRNPLADPGLLGVNAGASVAIVAAVALLGTTNPLVYIWFSFAGAAFAAILVYGLGATGRSGATPVRLALAGTAVTAALMAIVYGITLIDRQAFITYNFWSVGSLAAADGVLNRQIAPFIGVGLLIALALARPLNAIGLGDDAGRALGAHPGRTRALGALSVTLLCGAATAAAGPIVFVGLTVPHVARAIAGTDQRWVLPYSAVLAGILLLGADIIGRWIERPSELQVGIVTAVIGAPVFIALVRRRRIAQL